MQILLPVHGHCAQVPCCLATAQLITRSQKVTQSQLKPRTDLGSEHNNVNVRNMCGTTCSRVWNRPVRRMRKRGKPVLCTPRQSERREPKTSSSRSPTSTKSGLQQTSALKRRHGLAASAAHAAPRPPLPSLCASHPSFIHKF